MVRGLLAEFGIEMARGLHHALALARRLVAGEAPEVPVLAQRVVTGLADQIAALQLQLGKLEQELLAWHRSNDLSQRLATKIGRAHVCTPVTNAHLVCRLMLVQKKIVHTSYD